MANVALPTLAQVLRAPPGDTVMVVTSYQLALVMMLFPCAALGERFGNRQVFQAGVGVFVLGSILCAAGADPAAAGRRPLRAGPRRRRGHGPGRGPAAVQRSARSVGRGRRLECVDRRHGVGGGSDHRRSYHRALRLAVAVPGQPARGGYCALGVTVSPSGRADNQIRRFRQPGLERRRLRPAGPWRRGVGQVTGRRLRDGRGRLVGPGHPGAPGDAEVRPAGSHRSAARPIVPHLGDRLALLLRRAGCGHDRLAVPPAARIWPKSPGGGALHVSLAARCRGDVDRSRPAFGSNANRLAVRHGRRHPGRRLGPHLAVACVR